MKKIIAALIFLILLLAFGLIIWQYKAEIKRLKKNIEIEILGKSIAEDLTKKEYKRLYYEYYKLGDSLGIPAGRTKDVIRFVYRFKDSTITRLVLDTQRFDVPGQFFHVERECLTLTGLAYLDTVFITNSEYCDSLTVFVYGQKPQWIKIKKLIDWKKFWKIPDVTAKVYSKCKNDTISIQKHLHLFKND